MQERQVLYRRLIMMEYFLTLILMEIVIRQLLQKIADIGNRSIIGGGLLSLDGMGIMNFTLNDVPVNMKKLEDFTGIDNSEIDLYVCHQANKLILDALADKIGVVRDKLPFAASETGNTSSASIPLMLCREQYDSSKLEKVMLCGFGVGLACASCITDLSQTKILDVIVYE